MMSDESENLCSWVFMALTSIEHCAVISDLVLGCHALKSIACTMQWMGFQ